MWYGVCNMSRQLIFSALTNSVSMCRQVLQHRLRIAYGLSHFVGSGLTMTTDCEFSLLADEELPPCTVVGHVGCDCPEPLTVDFFNVFFPVSVSVGRPLKGQLHHLPGLPELSGAEEGSPQDLALQVRLSRLPRRAPDWKIEEDGAGGLECHAHFPKAAHAQGG